MNTLPLHQITPQLGEMLQQQGAGPVILTKDADAIAVVFPLPPGVRESGIDAKKVEQVQGYAVATITPPAGQPHDELPWGVPVFGRCRGMLTIVSDDDEHLRDFADYM